MSADETLVEDLARAISTRLADYSTEPHGDLRLDAAWWAWHHKRMADAPTGEPEDDE